MRLILIVFLMQANFILADIFRYQDDTGAISFSDQAVENSTKIELPEKEYRYKHYVKRVYDGDTIILQNNVRVRLLGINTPEIESRHRQGEEGGVTAKEWLKNKLSQGAVYLEYDQQKKDKYGRALAHLFLENDEHINETMVRSGLASSNIIPPNLGYVDELVEAEHKAQQLKIGIWAMKSYQALSVKKLSKKNKLSGWHRFLATPVDIVETRKYVRLVLTDKVDIRIPKDNRYLFPDLASYIGKSLEVRGWASRKKAHYSILIRHPSALVLL